MEEIADYIGPFEIRGKLGRGAMAVVWRGYDPSLDREVAIKEPVLPPESSDETRSEFAERFVREARAAARLNHPGIVTIYSATVFEDRPMIAMELVEGPTLRQVLDRSSLSTAQAYAVMEQLLQAVGYAHEHGVVHRDLKPDNIFLTLDGTVKLADFGIAHIDSNATMTRVGAVLGTPAYMSPEQIRGQDTDARADVFALGAIAYEVLGGTNPFGTQSSTHFATIVHRIMSEPTPALELEDSLGGPLAGVVMRALKKERENRFENAIAMLSAWRSAFPEKIDTQAELAVPMSCWEQLSSSDSREPREKTAFWGVIDSGCIEGDTGEAADGTALVGLAAVVSSAEVAESGVAADTPAVGEIDEIGSETVEDGSISSAVVDEVVAPEVSRKMQMLLVAAAVVALLISIPLVIKAVGSRANASAAPAVATNETTAAIESTASTKPRAVAPSAPRTLRLRVSASAASTKKGKTFALVVKANSDGLVPNGTRVLLERSTDNRSWTLVAILKIAGGSATYRTAIAKTTFFRVRIERSREFVAAQTNGLRVAYVAPKPAARHVITRRRRTTTTRYKKTVRPSVPKPPPPPPPPS